MRSAISRRSFLLSGIAGLVIVGGGAVRWRSRRALEQAERELTTLLRERSAAVEIGQEYLRLFPEEGEAHALVSHILGVEPQPAWSAAALKAAVDRRVRADFAAGQTVRIRGWVVSRTEARVSALLAVS